MTVISHSHHMRVFAVFTMLVLAVSAFVIAPSTGVSRAASPSISSVPPSYATPPVCYESPILTTLPQLLCHDPWLVGAECSRPRVQCPERRRKRQRSTTRFGRGRLAPQTSTASRLSTPSSRTSRILHPLIRFPLRRRQRFWPETQSWRPRWSKT